MRIIYKQTAKKINIIVLGWVLFTICGCKKFVEVDPPNISLNGGNIYSTDATAIAAVTSMYTKSGSVDGSAITGNITAVSIAAGLSADELTLVSGTSGVPQGLYSNDILPTSAPNVWDQYYTLIYLANSSIEGLSQSSSLTPAVKQQLLGESMFMRAFLYFYLVNLYGDVPLAISTNYKTNSLMPRTPASDVWQQIIKDLTEAKYLMNSNYVGADVLTSSAATERTRPNKWAAAALLTRVYLYTGDYANAEAQATEIINNSTFVLSTLGNAFLKNPSTNKETIWQIQTITTGWNTNNARVFILPNTGPTSSTYPVYLNKKLLNSFEPGDNRAINWIKGIKVNADSFYYAFKYKSAKLNDPVTEYDIVLRLAEQYLIRAEARAMQSKFQQAIDDVNKIRQQHGGLATPLPAPISQSAAMNLILNERRHELFTEWGHRWLDLKRTNTVDAVMSVETPLKGGAWQPTDKYYPISNLELQVNPNLEQTPGY